MRLILMLVVLSWWAGVAVATDVAATPADCDRVMALPDDSVTAIDIAGCYVAAKALLDDNRDIAAAETYFQFVCAAADLDTSPFACADLGRIYDSRGAAEAALKAYGQSCFHPDVVTADGAGCLVYGTRLLSGAAELVDAAVARTKVTDASHAFQRGCFDAVADACAANDALSDAIFAGDFGFDSVSCQIKDKTGQVTSDQTCDTFSQYTNLVEGEMLLDGIYIETFYFWPDTDRTRIAFRGGFWSLNGRPTGEPLMSDGYLCLLNPLTERQFCAELPEL